MVLRVVLWLVVLLAPGGLLLLPLLARQGFRNTQKSKTADAY